METDRANVSSPYSASQLVVSRCSDPLLVGRRQWRLVGWCICGWSALSGVGQRLEARQEAFPSGLEPGRVEDCLVCTHQGQRLTRVAAVTALTRNGRMRHVLGGVVAVGACSLARLGVKVGHLSDPS